MTPTQKAKTNFLIFLSFTIQHIKYIVYFISSPLKVLLFPGI